MIWAILIGWVVCGVVNYFTFRRTIIHVAGNWYKGDRRFAVILSIFGPLTLPMICISCFLAGGSESEEADW